MSKINQNKKNINNIINKDDINKDDINMSNINKDDINKDDINRNDINMSDIDFLIKNMDSISKEKLILKDYSNYFNDIEKDAMLLLKTKININLKKQQIYLSTLDYENDKYSQKIKDLIIKICELQEKIQIITCEHSKEITNLNKNLNNYIESYNKEKLLKEDYLKKWIESNIYSSYDY